MTKRWEVTLSSGETTVVEASSIKVDHIGLMLFDNEDKLVFAIGAGRYVMVRWIENRPSTAAEYDPATDPMFVKDEKIPVKETTQQVEFKRIADVLAGLGADLRRDAPDVDSAHYFGVMLQVTVYEMVAAKLRNMLLVPEECKEGGVA